MSGSELKADLWINEYITSWDIYAHGVTKVLAYQKTPYQEMYIVETAIAPNTPVPNSKARVPAIIDSGIYRV